MSNPDETAVCPYNKAHSIVLSRMQFHLTKCRAQHPNAEKVTCPFNTTHVVNKIELDWHIKWCKERIALDNLVCKVGADSPFVKPPTAVPIAPTVTSTNEVWGEEDTVGESVLEKVKEVSQTKPTLSNKICAPKSEKKAHRLNERLRFQQVLDARTTKSEEVENKAGHVEKKKIESQYPKNDEGYDIYESASGNRANSLSGESFPCLEEQKRNYRGQTMHTEEYQSASSCGTVPRDPKNPWAAARPAPSQQLGDIMQTTREESRNNLGGSRDENRNNIIKNEKYSAPSWGGWSVPNASSTASAESPVENITSSVQQISFNERRDPGNPWKLKNIAANFQGPANNDFPILPMSGKGRGKRIAK